MKKRFCCFLSALFVFFACIFIDIPQYKVSASFGSYIDPSVDADVYVDYVRALSLNSSVASSGLDLYACFGAITNNSCYVFLFSPDHSEEFTKYNRTMTVYFGSFGGNTSIALANLDDYAFTFTSLSSLPSSVVGSVDRNSVIYNTADSSPYVVSACSSSNGVINYNYLSKVLYIANITPTYQDDYLDGVLVGFDFSIDAFYDWLIETGKYSELPVYIGTSKLKSFISFYRSWGSSSSTFVRKILDWFSQMNIVSQSFENRNILKATIDRLYQEYCSSAYYRIHDNTANQIHHRKDINTNTDDDDLTLVTDDPNDSTIISILRDILRGVISIPTSIYNNTQMIISKLDSLNFSVTASNDGGGTDLTPVLDKMQDIIDALGSDTVNVEIDQTTQDSTDDFFDDWNLEFSTAIESKFPVAGQLGTLFTDFFEKCGVDVNSDGETFQYYQAVPLSRSASGSSESDIVSDFLANFDDSDPNFLNGASFNGVPDLSVTIGGNSVSIFSFQIYAKYRDQIHFIISFVIWTLYLLHLYKSLPQIIGHVADVSVEASKLE